jgi:hypothetical protein
LVEKEAKVRKSKGVNRFNTHRYLTLIEKEAKVSKNRGVKRFQPPVIPIDISGSTLIEKEAKVSKKKR